MEPRVFEAGGLERAIKLQRLPETMRETRMTLRRKIKVRAKGDTRLYVRVQQEDGHRMWSSPIYYVAPLSYSAFSGNSAHMPRGGESGMPLAYVVEVVSRKAVALGFAQGELGVAREDRRRAPGRARISTTAVSTSSNRISTAGWSAPF